MSFAIAFRGWQGDVVRCICVDFACAEKQISRGSERIVAEERVEHHWLLPYPAMNHKVALVIVTSTC